MCLNESYQPKQLGNSNGIGWYGKIPSNGDFVQRNLSHELVHQWAHWFQSSLVARQLSTLHNQRYSLVNAHSWYFILPATLGTPWIQLGCILPSQDSIGRHYPLLATWLESPKKWHNSHLLSAIERYYQIRQILQSGIHQCYRANRIDQALQVLPPLSPESIADVQIMPRWEISVMNFDPYRYSSFWWSNDINGKPCDTYIHSGHLTVQLFHYLFEPINAQGKAPRSIYKKMFG